MMMTAMIVMIWRIRIIMSRETQSKIVPTLVNLKVLVVKYIVTLIMRGCIRRNRYKFSTPYTACGMHGSQLPLFASSKLRNDVLSWIHRHCDYGRSFSHSYSFVSIATDLTSSVALFLVSCSYVAAELIQAC